MIAFTEENTHIHAPHIHSVNQITTINQTHSNFAEGQSNYNLEYLSVSNAAGLPGWLHFQLLSE